MRCKVFMTAGENEKNFLNYPTQQTFAKNEWDSFFNLKFRIFHYNAFVTRIFIVFRRYLFNIIYFGFAQSTNGTKTFFAPLFVYFGKSKCILVVQGYLFQRFWLNLQRSDTPQAHQLQLFENSIFAQIN